MLSDLNVQGAASGGMQEEDYKRYVDTLRKQAQIDATDVNETLDRRGLSKLKRKIGK